MTQADDEHPSQETAAPSRERLRALDIFRGATIAGMILVNDAGDWNKTYAPSSTPSGTAGRRPPSSPPSPCSRSASPSPPPSPGGSSARAATAAAPRADPAADR